MVSTPVRSWGRPTAVVSGAAVAVGLAGAWLTPTTTDIARPAGLGSGSAAAVSVRLVADVTPMVSVWPAAGLGGGTGRRWFRWLGRGRGGPVAGPARLGERVELELFRWGGEPARLVVVGWAWAGADRVQHRWAVARVLPAQQRGGLQLGELRARLARRGVEAGQARRGRRVRFGRLRWQLRFSALGVRGRRTRAQRAVRREAADRRPVRALTPAGVATRVATPAVATGYGRITWPRRNGGQPAWPVGVATRWPVSVAGRGGHGTAGRAWPRPPRVANHGRRQRRPLGADPAAEGRRSDS